MLFYVLLTIFVMAASVSANICCFKNEYQAVLAQRGGEIRNGVPAYIDRDMKMYYNYDMKMMRIVYQEEGTSFDEYRDYNKNKVYKLINNTCTESALLSSMQPPCVPANAVDVAHHVIGGPRENLTAITYHIGDDKNWMRLTVIPETCTPLAQVELDTVSATPSLTSIAFMDLEGLDGSHVFALPQNCKAV